MKIGIVGAEASKFTKESKDYAMTLIRGILCPYDILISGGCHLGGIDIWAEEIANEKGLEKIIYLPKIYQWVGGYRERNLLIAKNSDIVHNIVVSNYPSSYIGRRFDKCYHCNRTDHVKSGGCWTMLKAKRHYLTIIVQ